MAEDTITPEDSLADEPGTSSADGEGADSNAVDEALDGADTGEKSLIDKVFDTTGKKFASEKEALKAIKDTFGYVGDVGGIVNQIMKEKGVIRSEAVQHIRDRMAQSPTEDSTPTQDTPPVDTSQFVPRSEFEEANYYNTEEGSANKSHKGIIDAFKSKPEHVGKSIPEVIASDEELRNTLENAKAHNETVESKSVLQSNPRLGQTKDKLDSSREKVKQFQETGNDASLKGAETDAIDAVIDSMETK